MAEPCIIRPCFEQDLEQVQIIYAHHVLTGAGSFEIEPPPLEEIHARWSHVVQSGWPWLAACPAQDLSRVLGFAYAAQFRPRAAYAHAFEDSVYVAPNALRRGVGTRLLAGVEEMLRLVDARELIAVIGDSGNAASIGLHAAAGFRQVGVLTNVALKFDRWFDAVLMQKALNPHS